MEADRRIRHKRALLMERAAKALGMRGGKNPEAGFLLAGMIAVYVDSPSMRESGLTGLRWRGTAAELADDSRLRCSVRTVKRLLARFEEAGLIIRRTLVGDRGDAGIEIELLPRALQKFDVSNPPQPTVVPRDIRGDVRGDIPHVIGGDIGGDTARSVYSSVIPSTVIPSSSEEKRDDDEILEEEIRKNGIEQAELAKKHAKRHRITLQQLREASEVANHVWRDSRERGKVLYFWIKNKRSWPKSDVPTLEQVRSRQQPRAPDPARKLAELQQRADAALVARRRELVAQFGPLSDEQIQQLDRWRSQYFESLINEQCNESNKSSSLHGVRADLQVCHGKLAR